MGIPGTSVGPWLPLWQLWLLTAFSCAGPLGLGSGWLRRAKSSDNGGYIRDCILLYAHELAEACGEGCQKGLGLYGVELELQVVWEEGRAGFNWPKPGIFRLREHESVCDGVCTQEAVSGYVGSLPSYACGRVDLAVPWHWVCVCVLPDNTVNVVGQNRCCLLPHSWDPARPPPLGGGRASRQACARTGGSSSWNCFLVCSFPYTPKLGSWDQGGSHGSSQVELPGQLGGPGPGGQKEQRERHEHVLCRLVRQALSTVS